MTPEQDKFCDNNCVWTDHHPDCKLSQQEPEWYHIIDVHGCNRFYHKTEDCPYECRTPLYTTPPQRKPLTDEEIMNIAKVSCIGISPHEDTLNFAKVIEAVHGIKE